MSSPTKKHAQTVDLARIQPLAEIVLRAGDLSDPVQARKTLQGAYEADDKYDNVIGISVLFKGGANADELAQEGQFRHNRISISVVAKIVDELASIGYELVLFITPMPQSPFHLPDHHTLAVAKHGTIEASLTDNAADALIRSFLVVKTHTSGPKVSRRYLCARYLPILRYLSAYQMVDGVSDCHLKQCNVMISAMETRCFSLSMAVYKRQHTFIA